MYSFKDKGVLVTGADNSLGAVLADELLKQGARVSVLVQDLETSIRENGLKFIEGDITDNNEIEWIADLALTQLGQIDLVINADHFMLTDAIKPADALAANVTGPFRLNQLILRAMAKNKQGLIVNLIGNTLARTGRGWSSFSVAKAAMEHVSEAWYAEFKPLGIQYLALDPGAFESSESDQDSKTVQTKSSEKIEVVAQDLLRFIKNGKHNKVRYANTEWRDEIKPEESGCVNC